MGRIFLRAILWVVAACAAVWVADWAVWQVRVLAGGGVASVRVSRFVVAPLKGGKEEYYPDGASDVPCSQSMLPEGFPQVGMMPCWWVRRNPVLFER